MKKQPNNSLQANPKISEVKPSGDKNAEEFPGYPLYPANEDIMNRGQRLDLDLDAALENTQSGKAIVPETKNLGEYGTTSDLTKDDFQALASDELQSEGDDELLINRTWPVDFAAEDLDIPGSEQDDAQEQVGSEDEENNSYSVGSDRHADLEEDPS